jgi:glycosyltransferase involved in cell wall biosynthesis
MTKITVIIPTRQRPDTFESALRSCVAQDYENLAILVSDNDSGDNTRDITESFRDGRVRYLNTDRRLSMSANWEFALSHVDSGFVMYIGDDDALLPNAVADLGGIIADTGTEALCWKSAEYHWPQHLNPLVRNILAIPLGTVIERRDSNRVLADVLAFRRPYQELPHIYKGLAAYEALQWAKGASPRFFNSLTPDIYSGIALAGVVKEYYYSYRPYSINGASHHSIGTSNFSDSDKRAVEKFMEEDNLPFDARVAMGPSLALLVAECFLQAREHVPGVRTFALDMEQVVFTAGQQARRLPENQYRAVVSALRETIRLNDLDPALLQAAERGAAPSSPPLKPVEGVNLLRRTLLVDCQRFGARNVFEAALLCGWLLAQRKTNYFSGRSIVKTTIALARRELQKRRRRHYENTDQKDSETFRDRTGPVQT